LVTTLPGWEKSKITKENPMSDQKNEYGLYDSPLSAPGEKTEELDRAGLARQLEEGAFVLSAEQALAAGLLDPHDDGLPQVVVELSCSEAANMGI
jgi:hypothetical protein